MNNLVIGVVGHIDHGKTTLIKYLTGIDTDTLPEEKARGMTIDIGFSNLTFPSGRSAEIIDVPGHQKLIKNLATGISGINFFILVIACDDGIMPQTLEHFQILNLLEKKHGVIVLTKKDLVTEEKYEEVLASCKSRFKDISIFTVDDNKNELIEFLDFETSKYMDISRASQEFRLNIDKIYSIKGSGSVVTGTIIQGKVDLNRDVTLYPQGIKVKIKNIQNHGKDVKSLEFGKRCAINLGGIETKKISRGDVLASSNSLYVGKILDTKIYLLPEFKKLKNNHRMRLNIGTTEVMATVNLLNKNFLLGGDSALAQLILDREIPYSIGELGIIRDFTPIKTMGNFRILNSPSEKIKKSNLEYIGFLDKINLEEKIKYEKLMSKEEILKFENLSEVSESFDSLLKNSKIILLDKRYIHSDSINSLSKELTATLEKFYSLNHLSTGVAKADLVEKLFKGFTSKEVAAFFKLSQDIVVNENIVALRDHKIRLNKEEKILKEVIFSTYKQQKFNFLPMKELFNREDENFLMMHRYMVENNFIVHLKGDYFILNGFLKESIKLVEEFLEKNRSLSIRNLRDILNCNRDNAILILEKLDSLKITKLVDTNRILNINKQGGKK